MGTSPGQAPFLSLIPHQKESTYVLSDPAVGVEMLSYVRMVESLEIGNW